MKNRKNLFANLAKTFAEISLRQDANSAGYIIIY